MVKNSPANAGDVGLIPGHGTNISHAVGATEPTGNPRAGEMILELTAEV